MDIKQQLNGYELNFRTNTGYTKVYTSNGEIGRVFDWHYEDVYSTIEANMGKFLELQDLFILVPTPTANAVLVTKEGFTLLSKVFTEDTALADEFINLFDKSLAIAQHRTVTEYTTDGSISAKEIHDIFGKQFITAQIDKAIDAVTGSYTDTILTRDTCIDDGTIYNAPTTSVNNHEVFFNESLVLQPIANYLANLKAGGK